MGRARVPRPPGTTSFPGLALAHDALELHERLALDLPHAFAREPDDPADLLERHRLALAQAVAQAKDRRFALVDAVEQLLQPLEQISVLELFLGRRAAL